ncbi:LLM class flavin-dependent oxidoreductase [Phyllobacterium chamaecytisi]|uniref:LLM class flavin-dependent oxidoreductase n=1 Tax=Phyllobacterium chamaecytisi TaxID=2876082 RepID=UPI001CCE10E8|nr:LLM class flavin-dependent oxidoreductase [Phyllobacterium sp. KW56]MBZ9603215.1 LLM class flavin-dependent oxidoreductase [Phyllobacterium sp. KW56]
MTYALSLLDKSPIDENETAAAALDRTVTLVQKSERWGFHRFWVAEHHNNDRLASSSPEVLIAHLLAHTSRIRIGSGGVMLQHYSAYKVAENFNLLATLAPGRVDLGVGKAPGGLPLSTHALQGACDPIRKPGFGQQLAELDGFLSVKSGPEIALKANPIPAIPVQRFLLGASVESAQLAAAYGWDFVYASHLNGDEALLDQVFTAYHDASGGNVPLLAIGVIVAETHAQAERLAGDLRRFKVSVEHGQGVTVGSLEQAEEYVRQAGLSEYRIEERMPGVLRGTSARVQQELHRLHRRYGISEFILDCPATERNARLASIELLANAHFSLAA